MDLRHEWKHEISDCDRLVLRQRLSAVMQLDPHAIDGKYFIRSLYFDNGTDKALREKLDGINIREKFRIRYYNHDISVIHLEKKSKRSGLGSKETAPLSAGEAQSIVDGIGGPPAGAGALPENMRGGPGPEDHCGLHPGAVPLWTRKRPGDAGLRPPDGPSVHGLPEPRLHHQPCRRRTGSSGGQVGCVPAGHHPGPCSASRTAGRCVFQICCLQNL